MQDHDILKFFARYIEDELGIIYADHNYFQLQNRLDEIGKRSGLKSLQELYQACEQGFCSQFKQHLLDLATNNETSFFRDAKVFSAIENVVFREMAENRFDTNNFMIWSAASSTGQEAVSTAILINEYKAKFNTSFNFSIIGTDISERALTKAREGIYTELEVKRGLSPDYLQKYFRKLKDDQWAVNPEIRKCTDFQKLNLKGSFPFRQQFQLVLCRNVLIYQSVEGKKSILEKITETLAPGGFLVLGSGESLFGLSSDYEQIFLDGAVIYKKKIASLKVA